jgi:hypothetical protein
MHAFSPGVFMSSQDFCSSECGYPLFGKDFEMKEKPRMDWATTDIQVGRDPR